MAEAIETTGKTVEEALEQALKILGATREEIGYKVIEQPSKGVLGFFSKPAKIQAWLSNGQSNEVTEENLHLDEDISADEVLKVGSEFGSKVGSEVESDKVPKFEAVETEPEKDLSAEIKSFDATITTTRSVSTENTSIDQSETVIDENVPEEFSLESQKPKVDRATEFLAGVFEKMDMDVKISAVKNNSNYMITLSGDKLGILIGKHGQTLDALQYLTNLAANKNVSYDNRARFIIDVENYRSKREATLKELALHLADRVARTKKETRLEPMNRYERKVIHLALQENPNVTTYSEGEEPFRKIIIAPAKK